MNFNFEPLLRVRLSTAADEGAAPVAGLETGKGSCELEGEREGDAATAEEGDAGKVNER